MVKTTQYNSCVKINKKRAEEVLGSVYETYIEQRALYQHIQRESHAPQRVFIPADMERGCPRHQRWLYFSVLTDRRQSSEDVYESHVRFVKRFPDLYTEYSATMHPKDIAQILASGKVGSPKESAKYWPRCARTLFDQFHGDPLLLFRGRTIDEILGIKRRMRPDPLPGFGPKILSLLSLFYEELCLMQMPEDAFPVDVHVQRFAISTGILRSEGKVLNDTVEKALRPLICGIIRERGWSALELSHAIWLLGKHLCSGCYRSALPKHLCPSYESCGGSISTLLYFRKGTWDFDAVRHVKGGGPFTLPQNPLFPP